MTSASPRDEVERLLQKVAELSRQIRNQQQRIADLAQAVQELLLRKASLARVGVELDVADMPTDATPRNDVVVTSVATLDG